MRKYIIQFLAVLAFFSILNIGCTPRAKYEHRLKKELSSGVRYDSLFMGLYLGMPQKDFYTHCWQLNKMGLVKQGMRNTTVEYQIKKELKYPAAMNFYPSFVNNKIAEMPVQFTYAGWAPWNKSLSADSLQYDVLRWFRIMYGDGFIKIRHPQKGLAYVKIDGNRRITIFKENELNVWAVFSDMTVLKSANDTSVIGDLPESDTTKSTR